MTDPNQLPDNNTDDAFLCDDCELPLLACACDDAAAYDEREPAGSSSDPATRAAMFVAANAKSPVVSGYVIGNGGQGAVYTLENGQRFRLSRAASLALPKEGPRWKL